MSSERQLIAIAAEHDSTMAAYAAKLERLHHRARAAAPAKSTTRSTSATLVAERGPDVCVAAPSEVRRVDPATSSVEDVLGLSRRDDVDALLVAESAGRDLAVRLVREAARSVWFVPRGAAATVQRLLVPVDFSVRSADCLRAATTLAKISGGACDALHVRFNDAVFTHDWRSESMRRQRELDYAAFIGAVDCLGVRVTPLFEDTVDVSRAILDSARRRGSDLVVLGTRGRGRLAAWLWPSVAERVVREAHVPVLVVKHFGAKRGFLPALRDRLADSSETIPCN